MSTLISYLLQVICIVLDQSFLAPYEKRITHLSGQPGLCKFAQMCGLPQGVLRDSITQKAK